MKHHVQHPKYSREQLDGKRLGIKRHHQSTERGLLIAGEADRDGKYTLDCHLPAVPDTMIQGVPPRSSPNMGRIVQRVKKLDQDTVNKIIAAEGGDRKDFDFVIPYHASRG